MAKISVVEVKSKASSASLISEASPETIVGLAIQLRERERQQIIEAFNASHFDMVASYIWQRTIAALKNQLASLGPEFVGQMLDRPDIDSASEVHAKITEAEAITIAEALGILGSTQSMRLRQAQELIYHFSSASDPEHSDDDQITREDAISLLRVSTQALLSQSPEKVSADFSKFRASLNSETLKGKSEFIVKLQDSPYFFLKTTVKIIMALIKSETGAALEHVGRNTLTVISAIWKHLKTPERYLVGRTYSELVSDGKKDAAAALRRALEANSGFDFVPETLRSRSFIIAARELLEAHRGMNNFYNEPEPMSRLRSMGTTIPNPAFPQCVTATLCVHLGNRYGECHSAQADALAVLRSVSKERWEYYFNEVLPTEGEVLMKLSSDKPRSRWISFVSSLGIEEKSIKEKDVKKLLKATIEKKPADVTSAASRLLLSFSK